MSLKREIEKAAVYSTFAYDVKIMCVAGIFKMSKFGNDVRNIYYPHFGGKFLLLLLS